MAPPATLLTTPLFMKFYEYNDDFLFFRWCTVIGSITDSYLKELHPMMPIMYIKAITQDKQEQRNLYECPVYKTRQRGPTYIWTFNLKTKEKASKWILAGVALLLQI